MTKKRGYHIYVQNLELVTILSQTCSGFLQVGEFVDKIEHFWEAFPHHSGDVVHECHTAIRRTLGV